MVLSFLQCNPDRLLRSTLLKKEEGSVMPESVYKVIELVGTSEKSWEEAARNAVTIAGKSLKELRIAEITKLDLKIENGKVVAYRARVSLSFKIEKKTIL
jgi:flavin-binding protein dodecin